MDEGRGGQLVEEVRWVWRGGGVVCEGEVDVTCAFDMAFGLCRVCLLY